MNCAFCGKELVMPAQNKRKKYCGRICRRRGTYADYRASVPLYARPRNCLRCGTEFLAVRTTHKYCSHACGDRHRAPKFKAQPRYKNITRNSWLRKSYGITLEQFEKTHAEQDGKCKIARCGGLAKNVDHDHETGKYRGIICIRDNHVLGVDFLPKIFDRIEYLCEGTVS